MPFYETKYARHQVEILGNGVDQTIVRWELSQTETNLLDLDHIMHWNYYMPGLYLNHSSIHSPIELSYWECSGPAFCTLPPTQMGPLFRTATLSATNIGKRFAEQLCTHTHKFCLSWTKSLWMSFRQLASCENLAFAIREGRKSKTGLLHSFLSPGMWPWIAASSVWVFFPCPILFSLICAALKGCYPSVNACFNLPLVRSVTNMDVWMFIIKLLCLGSLTILHATILMVLIFAGHKACNEIPTPCQHEHTHV